MRLMAMDSSLLEQPLAILGGPAVLPEPHPELFRWPIVTQEDEAAVLEVLRSGRMSGWDLTPKFEEEWGRYLGTTFNLAHCNGTMAILAALHGVGVGAGDEVIVPSVTYWATATPVFRLGAVPVFADIDPQSLCIDPGDIPKRITPKTKAIIVVHYCGHPCDMDAIMTIARPGGIKVIEDLSHAHGALDRGRMVGTLGDVAAMSMMSAKPLAIGEGGMLSTNDREIYERALAFGHYERLADGLTIPSLRQQVQHGSLWICTGGVKARLNQTCAAMGRVQLKHYPDRMKRIQRAMNLFWDLLEGAPGLAAHQPPAGSHTTMGGWYNALGHYRPEELGGLPVERFVQAVAAEGAAGPSVGGRGVYWPLHPHPLFRDSPIASLPVSEQSVHRTLGVPNFRTDERPDLIGLYALAYRKVASQADKLR